MKLHQVRYALAVAECGGFTRAAEACNVTQPALSRAVRDLEGEFGGPLFERGASGARLTELGRIVLPHLQQIAREATLARHAAQEAARRRRSALRLGVMCTIAPSRLSPLMAAVATRRPDVELDIRDAAGPALRDALDDGMIDAAIMADPAPRDEAALHRLPLFTERMVIAMAPSHRLAGRERVLHADLSGEAYLSRARCEFGAAVDRSLAERGHAVSVVHRSERDDWILALVSAGLGCALAPEDMAAGAGVTYAPFDEPPLARRVELVTLRGRAHGPALGALVREAVRLFVIPEG